VYYGEMAGGHASTEGLDRFADFFRAPIFDSDSVAAEVHAINSEHEKKQARPKLEDSAAHVLLVESRECGGSFPHR